ncbi:mitochondrial ribosomal protein L16 [Mycena olivaceomarginata]|nr:mitochondrial ribosomal protein L16 [Mycena olivaceomarginata]
MFSLSSLFARRPPFVPTTIFSRARNNLAPRQVKHIKKHKGRVPIPIGGSTKGTTLAYGDWGIRIKGNGARLSAKQLETAEEVIKKKLKVIKGVKVYLRVFPDISVCIKGNETRMGKGKGTFEFWATRVPIGRVILEIGGTPIREELAREALRLASSKLPTQMEFIRRSTPPRLGNLVLHPPKPPKPASAPPLDLAPPIDSGVQPNV